MSAPGREDSVFVHKPYQDASCHGSDTDMQDPPSSKDTEMGETPHSDPQSLCSINKPICRHPPMTKVIPESRRNEKSLPRSRTVINLKEALKACEAKLQKAREDLEYANKKNEVREAELRKAREDLEYANKKHEATKDVALELLDKVISLKVSVKPTSKQIEIDDNIAGQKLHQRVDDESFPAIKKTQPKASDQMPISKASFIHTDDQKENNSSRRRRDSASRCTPPPRPVTVAGRHGSLSTSRGTSSESSERTAASSAGSSAGRDCSSVSVQDLKGRVAALERKIKSMSKPINKKHDSGISLSSILGDSPRSSVAGNEMSDLALP
jgi:hypothetical protein